MNTIATLTEFIESGGLSLHFSDMGRRVSSIPREHFVAFELTEIPYPLPLQQQAWFALTLADPKQPQIDPMIWFIRFPLDEQGKLLLSARDEFMHHLVESLGSEPDTDGMRGALQNNPYAFQPKQERLAIFHARLTQALRQPASRYYDHAKAYFDGDLGWEQWSFIGYQGIADVAARLDQHGNTQRVRKSIPSLPPSPLEVLCHCLENEVISHSIADALAQRGLSSLHQERPDPQVLSAVVRGLSQSQQESIRNDFIYQLLDHPIAQRSDLLAAIAGRAWESLEDSALRHRYLERLADNEAGQAFFNGILSDLLYLPATRQAMQASLRDPQRSQQMSQVIGAFFSHVRGE
ncbi:MAG: DUF3549 family protein [Candidatus Thiodiazotropha sp.]